MNVVWSYWIEDVSPRGESHRLFCGHKLLDTTPLTLWSQTLESCDHHSGRHNDSSKCIRSCLCCPNSLLTTSKQRASSLRRHNRNRARARGLWWCPTRFEWAITKLEFVTTLVWSQTLVLCLPLSTRADTDHSHSHSCGFLYDSDIVRGSSSFVGYLLICLLQLNFH